MMHANRNTLVSNPDARLTALSVKAMLLDPESPLSKEYAAAQLHAALVIEVKILLLYFALKQNKIQCEIEARETLKQQLQTLSVNEFNESFEKYYEQKILIAAQATQESLPAAARADYTETLQQLNDDLTELENAEKAEKENYALLQKPFIEKWDEHQQSLIGKVIECFTYKKDNIERKLDPESNEAKNIKALLAERASPTQLLDKLRLKHLKDEFTKRKEEYKDSKKSLSDTEAAKEARKDLKLVERNITHIIIKILPEYKEHVKKHLPDVYDEHQKSNRLNKFLTEALEKMLKTDAMQEELKGIDDLYIEVQDKCEKDKCHRDLVITCSAKKEAVEETLKKIAEMTENAPQLKYLLEEARKELKEDNSAAAELKSNHSP